MTDADRAADWESGPNDMSVRVVDLEADLASSRMALEFMTGHCKTLAKTWEAVHGNAMAVIRNALGFAENSSVYDMAAEIRRLKRAANGRRNQ